MRTVYERFGYAFRSNKHGWGAIHKAVEMRLAGEANASIAGATGMTGATLGRLFRELRMVDPREVAAQRARSRERGRDYAADEAEAARLYRERCSQNEVRAILGVGTGTVSRMLQRKGVRVRRRAAAVKLHWEDHRGSSRRAA